MSHQQSVAVCVDAASTAATVANLSTSSVTDCGARWPAAAVHSFWLLPLTALLLSDTSTCTVHLVLTTQTLHSNHELARSSR